ncbi:hypothetical protein [Chryseobacterium phocaeense]|uniref:hypothetical protein n=1 Tax=Chryseobacterium phocaeense TaxID=1816690 RepID=UPI0009BC2EBB|nr:hypothetical protein [Chryseobacterium phocaeense]
MKKYFIINVIYLLSIFSCKDVNKFSAGSYPYAEVFEISLSEKRVIEKIDSLKTINTELQVPVFEWAGNEVSLSDEVQANGYFVFYIFIKERNQIIQFYAKENGKNHTKIGFISIQNGLSLGNWRKINKDLPDKENKQLKEIFKKRIISKIN